MSATSVLPTLPDLDALVGLLRGRRVVVLAGAGCSTESGIPDYRGPGRRSQVRKPMQYGEFVRSGDSRVRYWSRSSVGWSRIRDASPNAAHRALARLEEGGLVQGVITQNVDGLHQTAGSRRVVELHGSLAWILCLECGERIPRAAFQGTLEALNRDWFGGERPARPVAAPDGDADLPSAVMAGFRVPPCEGCGGVLKPDVVFFGECVPPARVAEAWALFEEGEVLLVVGSSLTVFSGRRFPERARRDGVPVAVVNLGPTRADEAAAVKVEGRLGEVLPKLAEALLR